MEIKTFRARTMQEALDMVRQEMGMEATVLHTRELQRGWWHRLRGSKQYEIAASYESPLAQPVSAPALATAAPPEQTLQHTTRALPAVAYEKHACHAQPLDNDASAATACPRTASATASASSPPPAQHAWQGVAQQLQERTAPQRHLSESLFQIYTDMIEADIDQQLAQQLLERLQARLPRAAEHQQLRAALVDLLEELLPVSGAIQLPAGQSRLVALVGPTGVGKTTTIAKLAANYRLRENRRVGLLTVDTYRIAAVEQLRTYADIIDLPMEVVSTPREMREAVARMQQDVDLILMDTAGRSPRDEVKIQELKSMLAEADPDEVHLVQSAVASTRGLITTAEKFASVGTTSMLITKLDEATCLGNLVGLTQACQLPLSYLTDGQNVPDDIQVAAARALAGRIVGEGGASWGTPRVQYDDFLENHGPQPKLQSTINATTKKLAPGASTMPDQADILRQLVRQTVHALPAGEPRVPLVVVSGGDQGVGASTVAWQLARELASLGKRTVVVDANLTQPDLTRQLAVSRDGCLGDVLAGSRTAAEVIAPVGERLGFLPAHWNPQAPPPLHQQAVQRFLEELLESQADVVLLDAGPGMSPWVEWLWQAAQQILLVASPSPAAITASYATIKLAAGENLAGKLRLVFNRAEPTTAVARVVQDFSDTCQEFLGLHLEPPATLPPRVTVAPENGTPGEHREFSQAVRLLAANLVRHCLVVSHRLQRPPASARPSRQQAKNNLLCQNSCRLKNQHDDA